MKKLFRSIAVLSMSAAMLFCEVGMLGASALEKEGVSVNNTGKVIDSAPPVPSITELNTVDWDAGWYRMESDLQLGECIYSVDYDPNNTEYLEEDADDYTITALPEEYIGSDYIINRRKERQAVFFRAEQDIYVYAAVDARYSATHSFLTGWTDTGDTMQTKDGTSYRIYERAYAEGLVYINKIGNDSDTQRNYFLMVLPQNGVPISKALTDNPVVPEGQIPANAEDANDSYTYYINDVYTQTELPAGYTTYGESGGNTVSVASSEEGEADEVNYALGAKYETSSNTRKESPVDGNASTYWQGEENKPAYLIVDLGQVRDIREIVLRLPTKETWANRTQRLKVTGGTDGASYTETLVPEDDYLFVTSEGNFLSFEVSASIRYIRVDVYSNDQQGEGTGSAQLGELEAIGYENGNIHTEHTLVLEKSDWNAAAVGVKRALESPATGKVVVETRVKADGKSRRMEIPGLYDAAGNRMAYAEFGTNGYIQAGGIDLVPYDEGVWYPVRIVADTETKTYDVWINHLQKGEDIPFEGGTGGIAEVRYSAAEGSEGVLSVDYLRAFDYTEIYVLEEEFDEAQTGSVPEGWSVTGTGAVAEFPFPEDKSLKLEGAGSQAEYSFGALRGDVTVEAKVRPVESTWVTAPLITDASGKAAVKVALYRNSIFISNGDNWVYICDQEVPNNYYGSDNWFYIKVVLNTYTNRYDFYVDGAKRYTGASLAEDVEEVSRVIFKAEEANTLYVDKVKVYDSASLARGLMPEENVYNVKDYGAKGDGVTDDTEAINAAIEDAAYTGGTVLLENGVFYTGQITLYSDMTLFIDESATIYANMDRNVYTKVIPSNGYNGNKQLGRGIIWFEDAKNVRITGGGTIFGNGFYGFGENDPSNQRPCIIYFASCEDVYIENINMVQSPFWTLVPYESSDITIRNVNITNHVAPNRDGIDPVNSSNITVENCLVIAGDDAFCPKSGNMIPSRNVEVYDCFFQSYCNGIKFGTDSQGPFSNYYFEDIYMKGVGMSGIALEAVDGSDMEYLTFKRIEMTDVDNAMFAAVGNRMRTPYNIEDAASYKHLGRINNIVLEDVRYTNCMQWPYSHKKEDIHEILLYGLNPEKNTLNDGEAHRISNVLFKNVYLEMPGGKTEVPDFDAGLGGEYPEHQELGDSVGYGYTLRWTDNVRFENCTTVLLAPDVRQEIAKADYTEEEVFLPGEADFALGMEDIKVNKGTEMSELPLPETVKVVTATGQIVDVAVEEWVPVADYDGNEYGRYAFRASLKESGTAQGSSDLYAEVYVMVTDVTEEPENPPTDPGTPENPGETGETTEPGGGCSGTVYSGGAMASLLLVGAGAAVALKRKKRSGR